MVTHNVSVMIVQAGAARKIMSSSQADAEDALLAVEATGREAMTELRNLLGLLSPAADGADAIDAPVAGSLLPALPLSAHAPHHPSARVRCLPPRRLRPRCARSRGSASSTR